MSIRPSNYKKLDVEKCLSLIQSIKAMPVLWDRSSQDFHNKRKQHCAWKEVAAQEGYSVQEAKRQWKVLLSCFRTYKAKVKKSMRTETEPSDIYKPCWFAYEPMMFICEGNYIARNMQETTMSAVHSISPIMKESPKSSPSEERVYSPEENSCSQLPLLPVITMVSNFPCGQSPSTSPVPSEIEGTAGVRRTTAHREDNHPKIDMLEGTNQLMLRTSAVIGNEVARWIETFEPRVQNLAIGRLYIAMHQIEQDIRTE